MATGSTRQVVRQLRRFAVRETDALTDGQLLDCFVAQRDEAAFAALVRRHGPMVWGVCRRIVGHAEDAEDAFQAAFLVLARKASTVRPRELVGHWLYGVASRTALKAKAVAARRRERERQVPVMPPAEIISPADVDWLPLLDRELGRLPEKYRVPIVLCDLEGRTRRDVARQLKVPDGTLSNRLASGRRMLARRLARHGVTLSAGALAAALVADGSAGVPAPLVVAAVRAATADALPDAVSSAAVTLSEGVIKAMLLNRLKLTTVILTLSGLIALGLGASALSESRADAPPAPAPAAPKSDRDRLQGAWLQVAAVHDGVLEPLEETKREGKRWTFHGDRFLSTRVNEPAQVIEARFTLDPSRSPKHFDYVADGGNYKGKTIPSLYRLDDDFLIVRDDMNGKARPTAIRLEQGAAGRIMVFGREGAAAKGTDDEFLKRICKELRGNSPTPVESQYFKADADAAKRAKVIACVLGATTRDPTDSVWLDLGRDRNQVFGQLLMQNTLYPDLRFFSNSTIMPIDPNLGYYPPAQSLIGKSQNYIVGSPYPQWQQGLNAPVFLDPLNANLFLGTRLATAVNQDGEFLRRLSLDLIGTLPTPLEMHYFVTDQDPKKREKVVNWLVKSDAYAKRSAERWKAGPASGGSGNDRLGQLLDRLLADQKPDAQVLEALTLAALARYPTDTETALIVAQVAKQTDRKAAWNGVLTTLLQTAEAQQHIDSLNRRRSAK
ncbi:MAG: sigma-70 family RNA polymerase sigma factor [Gemmataceae bacterium]